LIEHAMEPHDTDLIRAALRGGDLIAAEAKILGVYGAEVYGFVTAAIGETAVARDVYARFVDELRRALPGFTWRCELRTFAYFVACRELRRRRELAGSDAHTRLSLPSTRGLRPPHRRSRTSVAAAVRRCLSPEDRELLVLRVDRELGWGDLALTSLGDHASDRELEAEADRLQRHFLNLRVQIMRLTRRVLEQRATRRR
jgi:hypothetical protein